MSSSESLREFISQRLTAAAAEIFSEFEKTIVQYEEEIDRQRRLLDITWRPEVKLHRTDLQQDLIFKEEDGGPDQQLCNQDRNSCLDQEEPEPPRIKEEPEEEQLVLKEEAEVVMVTPAADGSDHSGPEPGPNMDPILCQNSLVPETQKQEETDQEDCESSRGEGPEPNGNNVDASESRLVSCEVSQKKHQKIQAGRQYPCRICDRSFTQNHRLLVHMRTHAGGKAHACRTCGKSCLLVHRRRRGGEEASTCGARRRSADLAPHAGSRSDPAEKLYLCIVCHKGFARRSGLVCHRRTHTGEKPFACGVCGGRFTQRPHLSDHMRIHTGERPFACTLCARTFTQRSHLICHTRTHTGEKPFACRTCGKSFSRNAGLMDHRRRSCSFHKQKLGE